MIQQQAIYDENVLLEKQLRKQGIVVQSFPTFIYIIICFRICFCGASAVCFCGVSAEVSAVFLQRFLRGFLRGFCEVSARGFCEVYVGQFSSAVAQTLRLHKPLQKRFYEVYVEVSARFMWDLIARI